LRGDLLDVVLAPKVSALAEIRVERPRLAVKEAR